MRKEGALLAVLLGLLLVAAPPSPASAIEVTNPGSSTITIDSGFIKIGSTPEQSISSLPTNPSIAGVLSPDGSFEAPVSGFSFGRLLMPVAVPPLGTATYGLDLSPTEPVSGTIDPVTGEVKLTLKTRIKLTLVNGSPLADVGSQCFIGSDTDPMHMTLSTEAESTPGLEVSTGGRPFIPGEGNARVADNAFTVPGQSGCAGVAGGMIDSQLGLPLAAAKSVSELALNMSPAPLSPPGVGITKKPSKISSDRAPSFRFRSNLGPGFSFECRLDQQPWVPCQKDGDVNLAGLALGQYRFEVRSKASGGVEGPGTEYVWSIVDDTSPPDAALRINPQPVEVNQPAELSATLSNVQAGVKACVSPSPSAPACGYRWDFNDDGVVDQVTNEPTTVTRYATVGVHVSRLTVFDQKGRSSIAQDTVEAVQARSVISPRPWLPPLDLSEEGASTDGAEVSSGVDGTSAFVWRRTVGQSSLIEARVRTPDGSLGPVETVSRIGEDSRLPDVVVGPDGSVTVVWLRTDESHIKVVQTRTRPPHGTFGPIEMLTRPEPAAENIDPRVAIGPDGTTVVVWHRFNGGLVVQSRTRPPGGSFEPVQNISENGKVAFVPDVVVNEDRSTTIVWQEFVGPLSDELTEIRARTRPPGGEFGPIETLSVGGHAAHFPRAAAGPAGTTFTWIRSNGENYIVQARTRESSGEYGQIEDLSATGSHGFDAEVRTGSDGTTAIVWRRFRDSESLVQGRVRRPGSDFGPILNVSGAGRDAKDPHVAIGPSGEVVFVWSRFDGVDDVAQTRTLLGSGEMTVTENLSDQGTAAWEPGVTFNGEAGPTAVWSTVRGGGEIIQFSQTKPAPPETVCPPKLLKVLKLKRKRRSGNSRVLVRAGGPGRIVAKGSRWTRKSAAKLNKAARAWITIRPRTRKLRTLRKRGRRKVKVRMTYLPDRVCEPATRTWTLVLRAKRR